jgi:hypothetical protein
MILTEAPLVAKQRGDGGEFMPEEEREPDSDRSEQRQRPQGARLY